MEAKSKALLNFLVDCINEKPLFVDEMKELFHSLGVDSSPFDDFCNSQVGRVIKRKYPERYEDLTSEQKEEIARSGFARVVKRRKIIRKMRGDDGAFSDNSREGEIRIGMAPENDKEGEEVKAPSE